MSLFTQYNNNMIIKKRKEKQLFFIKKIHCFRVKHEVQVHFGLGIDLGLNLGLG
jgi:hypothetical protein